MVAYSLECVDCAQAFRTRAQWFEHLLQPCHSECRSVDMKRSLGNGKLRKCVLVVYSAFPVFPVGFELLQVFSGGGEQLVTDFVTVAHKPRMGILCYESRKQAAKAYLAVGGPQVRICNQLVEIKKGTDFLDLEWKELISSVWRKERGATVTAVEVENLYRICVSDLSSSANLTPSNLVLSHGESSEAIAANLEEKLVEEFQRICDHVGVDPEQYKLMENVCQALKTTFKRKFSSLENVHLMRAWGFKLE